MNIIKPLQLGLLHRNFCWQQQDIFCVTATVAFDLATGDILLEQDMWQTLGHHLKRHGFDSGMPKGSHEVIMVGKCFPSTNGKSQEVRLCVQENERDDSKALVDKVLTVNSAGQWVGDRVNREAHLKPTLICYQNAYGAEDFEQNPVGLGSTVNLEPPCIEYPEDAFSRAGQAIQPAAFCPLDYNAAQRRQYAGTYDQRYINEVMPNLANDLDMKFFNDSMSDQWLPHQWTGQEVITIANMHSEQPMIRCKLPTIYARSFIQQHKLTSPHDIPEETPFEFKEIPLSLDTVWLCPNDNMGILMFRGTTRAYHSDGIDVTKLMLACEDSRDDKRSLSHYEEQMRLRTCPENGFKYGLYSAPLIANGMQCAFDQMQSNGDFPLELLQKDNIDKYVEQNRLDAELKSEEERQKIADVLREHGIEEDYLNSDEQKKARIETEKQQAKIDDLVEQVAPNINDKDSFDLSKVEFGKMDQLFEEIEKISSTSKEQAILSAQQEIAKLKSQPKDDYTEQRIKAMEEGLLRLSLPAAWPRNNLKEQTAELRRDIESMKEKQAQLRELGVAESEITKLDVDVKELLSEFDEAEKELNKTYREGAHAIENAVSPHPGKEDQLREYAIAQLSNNADLSGNDFACVDFSGLDLSNANLSECLLEGCKFINCDLTRTNFSNAIAVSCLFKDCYFHTVSLDKTNLGRSQFVNCVFTDCDMTHTELMYATYQGTTFTNCQFPSITLIESSINETNFRDCDFEISIFINVIWKSCHFEKVTFNGSHFVENELPSSHFHDCDLSSSNFLDAQANGTEFINGKLENTRFVGQCELRGSVFKNLDLNMASFRGAQLSSAVFSNNNMKQADMSQARMDDSILRDCNMQRALFQSSYLNNAELCHSNFMEASFYGAYIRQTNFSDCNLYGANFVRATMGINDYHGANLDRTIIEKWRPQ